MALALGKLVVCAVGGALLGGAAVHVAEKPRRAKAAAVRKAPARPAVSVAPPCEVPEARQIFGNGVGQIPVELLPSSYAPAGGFIGPAALPAGTEPGPDIIATEVPEPAAFWIIGTGLLGTAVLRARRR